ncbi:class I SAM-dependent methyltransferase [Polynucleobacter difficilis]|uniref:class I SAM-dependent methyltransferase n=1 Tax=Polynucleobacter difficilis TaxID=556054 RepID=UPI000D3CC26A|nr:class I SAM-dependent methyltransferase [Polynucleobacter difficilis]
MTEDQLELGSIPFYWRAKRTISEIDEVVPERLPFSFAFEKSLQLLIQKPNLQVNSWLNYVYKKESNVGYLQEGHSLAESYGNEFLAFFNKTLDVVNISSRKVLDIGCGGVYLLRRLRDMGMDVRGMDPSPITVEAGKKIGIPIIPEFYPSPLMQDKYNVIYHYDVLEHVEDPVKFLSAHHQNLERDGLIVIAVPNCSNQIKNGDASMAIHEHLNYFDKQSLANVLNAANFEIILIEESRVNGVLLCSAIPSRTNKKIANEIFYEYKFQEFIKKYKTSVEKIKKLAMTDGELGIYIPIRFLPFINLLEVGQKIRFFDDDPGLYGKYYDGVDIPIENLKDLIITPPKKIIICSYGFANLISEKICNSLGHEFEVIKWSDIFS